MRIIGDVVILQRGTTGRLQGVILRVDVTEPMTIAILSDQWPADIREGVRLDVKGYLCNERVAHKRNTHFLQATHVDVVRRYRPAATAAGAQ